jgi:hypothetical protein
MNSIYSQHGSYTSGLSDPARAVCDVSQVSGHAGSPLRPRRATPRNVISQSSPRRAAPCPATSSTVCDDTIHIGLMDPAFAAPAARQPVTEACVSRGSLEDIADRSAGSARTAQAHSSLCCKSGGPYRTDTDSAAGAEDEVARVAVVFASAAYSRPQHRYPISALTAAVEDEPHRLAMPPRPDGRRTWRCRSYRHFMDLKASYARHSGPAA